MLKNSNPTAVQQQYEQAPPPYEEESSRPFLPDTEEVGEDIFKETVANSSIEIRMQFVRKVYSILTAQILGTIIMSVVYISNEGVKTWVQTNPWMVFVSMFGSLGVLFALMWKARSTPLNFYLLGLFTLLESHMVGTIVTFYDQAIVVQALGITFVVFLALTIFTFQSKWDFSGLGPILFAGIWILLIAGILLPFVGDVELPLAIAGVIIFSGYIIFDTYLIFNRYSPEDYIMASTSLYLDMINLFLRILQILNASQRD
ncbi:inhibitor of apoptosis-promoting Bax1-domain-containing protein [Mycotypha africana]|uniref:inhibitor of apoptosis-promoting Bax1-domain-containing protein n=1 Tax=Mycotypha africana TaxID=64632 RepID=UPI002301EAD5|nr:inhibitor of apoptosis-promoting Bax1-domain-containing protein [Mycotypha africana]KAI8984312.1 inhibitor of apoptosis-promoting Bax1-domain-containing protein [Mycotypha africana]